MNHWMVYVVALGPILLIALVIAMVVYSLVKKKVD